MKYLYNTWDCLVYHWDYHAVNWSCFVLSWVLLLMLGGILLNQWLTQYMSTKCKYNYSGVGEIVADIYGVYGVHMWMLAILLYGSYLTIIIGPGLINGLTNIISGWVESIVKMLLSMEYGIYIHGLPWPFTVTEGRLGIDLGSIWSHGMSTLGRGYHVKIQPPVSAYLTNVTYYENIKPLQNYNYWFDQEKFKYNDIKMKITTPYLSSSYHLYWDKNTNTVTLKKNGTNDITEFHCHMHMEYIVEQVKKQGILKSNEHYMAFDAVPNQGKGKQPMEQSFADGGIVLLNSQGGLEGIMCTFQHKCIEYGSYLYEGAQEKLLEKLELHYNNYPTVDFIIINCVNPKTFNNINNLLVQNPQWASKIIPVDLSYQWYGHIKVPIQHNMFEPLDLININKWNDWYDLQLPQIKELAKEIHKQIALKHELNNFNSFYHKQVLEQTLSSNPVTKVKIQEVLSNFNNYKMVVDEKIMNEQIKIWDHQFPIYPKPEPKLEL